MEEQNISVSVQELLQKIGELTVQRDYWRAVAQRKHPRRPHGPGPFLSEYLSKVGTNDRDDV